jgi:hypothetical protein
MAFPVLVITCLRAGLLTCVYWLLDVYACPSCDLLNVVDVCVFMYVCVV